MVKPLRSFTLVCGMVISLLLILQAHAQPQSDAAPVPLSVQTVTKEAINTSGIRIVPAMEFGYFDAHGRYVVDLMQQDYTYIAVRFVSETSEPLIGITPHFSIEGTSQLLKPHSISTSSATDENGKIEFAVLGGKMGLDRIVISDGEARIEILINVISLRATTFLDLVVQGEDFLSWDELIQARTRYENGIAISTFPDAIAEQSGQTVKLSGFVTPLQASHRQSHFLLTSHPPGCFHEPPGGPSGIVEVFVAKGVEFSPWAPLTLEGRLETVEKGTGSLYRLHDARVL